LNAFNKYASVLIFFS